MAEQAVELPAWVTDIVEQCKESGNFTPLIDEFSSYHASQLEQTQRDYLYKLAEEALIQRAQRWWWLVRSGRFEIANRLYYLVTTTSSHSKLDLKQYCEWEMVEYARRIHELKEAYRRAKEENWRHGKVLLADNLLASDPIDTWLYADDSEVLFRLARESYLDELQADIELCRSGDGGARSILRAMQVLHYEWSDLGITKSEVERWARQHLIKDVRSKLHFGLNGGDELLYANIYGSLKLMLQHGISPEEVGTTKEQLAEAKRRLERWVRQGISESHGPEYRDQRRTYREFLDTVLPLFEQIL